MQTVTVNGVKREDLGKKATKAARKAGHIPCVLYGGEAPLHFSTDKKEVKALIYTGDFKISEIVLDGKTYRSILKDVQFHPVTDEIMHIDFLQLVEGNAVKVNLPIRFKGSSPGEKLGGKIQQNLRKAKVKTKPEYLVDELFVDISEVQLGQSVRVRDIESSDNLEIMNSPGIPVATCTIPRALRSAGAKAEAEAEEVG